MTPRRADLLGALSLAIDLGLGQPMEHVMRSALAAERLALALGCSDADRAAAFYTTVLMWIGCHADSHEYAQWFGDDIAVRQSSYLVDWAGVPYARFLLQSLGRGRPFTQRIKITGAMLRDTRGNLSRLVGSHCTSAGLLACRLGLDESVQNALPYTFERFDGAGLPVGASGETIPLAMRVAQVADVAEVHHRLGGVDAASETVRRRSGGQFDPAVARAFLATPTDILVTGELPDWRAATVWQNDRAMPAAELASLLSGLGEFVDLKSPYTLGHSAGVSALAAAAGRHVGLTADEIEELRRAGQLHDLGRIGVSNLVWDKARPLTQSERERVEMHPYLTERMLRQVGGLQTEASLAAKHHERLDGSGYPRGLTGSSLSVADQTLAAADCFRSAIEPRPYRPPASRQEAAEHLRAEVRAGRLGAQATAAVLAAAGEVSGARGSWPDDLTNREVEILRLVARARTTTQIATELSITEKTVRNHIEHLFAKTGVSNRVGASLYAIDHGLLEP
jgi:HD-GYP domain-containing protein (c-di-GMP phosphodiesterase class II)/DNA-binding CsgD family transcriptional regulator